MGEARMARLTIQHLRAKLQQTEAILDGHAAALAAVAIRSGGEVRIGDDEFRAATQAMNEERVTMREDNGVMVLTVAPKEEEQ